MSRFISIEGLKYKDTYNSIFISINEFQKLSLVQQLTLLVSHQKMLDAVWIDGYLASNNLTDFPLISKYVPLFLLSDNITTLLPYINGNRSKDSYK